MRLPAMAIRIIALVVAAVGLWLLLASPTIGESAASALLRQAGGSMDGAKWQTLLEASISGYRWLGAILVALGLYRASEGLARGE